MLHYRTCNLCEAMCGITVEHDGERVLSIRGDDHDPFSAGYICPKATALGDLHHDPDRLRAPLRRTGSSWQTCDWEAALTSTAERLAAIQKSYGRDSVAVYAGNPTAHNFGAMLYGLALMQALGTKNRFSATSTDQLPHMLAGLLMFGHQVLMPVPDLDRCEHLLMLGANPVVSNGSIMAAPGIKRRLERLTARGGRLVVVDPRRTETAALASEHVFIRPGSDALLLAAMIRTIVGEGRASLRHLASFTDGLDELRALTEPFTPERVAGPTGIAASSIERLARDFAGARHAACYGRVGICQGRFGGLAGWLVNAVNIITGNLDHEGGMMFTTPAVDIVALAGMLGQRGQYDTYRSRVRGLPEFGGELPAAVLAEEIEAPGDGQIRALVTLAGNPVLSTPNGTRLEHALGRLDFMVSIDIYQNETTRHADYILPPTSQLEQSHYDVALSAFAVRNVAKYSAPCFDRPAGAKHDWEILAELATRIVAARDGGGAFGLAARAASAATRAGLLRLGPEGVVAQALRFGPHGRGMFGRTGLSLDRLRAQPHGVDLGPLEPRFPHRLATPDKRIRLAPREFAADMARLAAELDRPVAELVLIGRRQLRNNNSWLHNSLRLVKGKDRCSLLMHPDDAAARGLSHEQRVRLRSRVGAVEVPLHVSDQMMPGVVSLPHGFGHDRDGVAMDVARAHPGASVNDVTDELLVDEMSGMAALNGVPVTVEPV